MRAVTPIDDDDDVDYPFPNLHLLYYVTATDDFAAVSNGGAVYCVAFYRAAANRTAALYAATRRAAAVESPCRCSLHFRSLFLGNTAVPSSSPQQRR